MKLRRINPDKIQVPKVRVTARFDDETWEQFQKSIKEVGAIAPIICCEVDGELVLVDGLHRLVESRRNGATTIDVVVIPGDMVDVLTKNLYLDHMRGKTPASEMVTVIEALWKEYGLDSEKIAERTGLTREYVEKLQVISQLTPKCRAALDEERIRVGHAFALTKIKDPVLQETVLLQLMLYHWGVKELEGYIVTLAETLEQKSQVPSKEERIALARIRCFFCGEEFELGKIANPNTCVGCSHILLASIAEAEREIAVEQPPQNEP